LWLSSDLQQFLPLVFLKWFYFTSKFRISNNDFTLEHKKIRKCVVYYGSFFPNLVCFSCVQPYNAIPNNGMEFFSPDLHEQRGCFLAKEKSHREICWWYFSGKSERKLARSAKVAKPGRCRNTWLDFIQFNHLSYSWLSLFRSYLPRQS